MYFIVEDLNIKDFKYFLGTQKFLFFREMKNHHVEDRERLAGWLKALSNEEVTADDAMTASAAGHMTGSLSESVLPIAGALQERADSGLELTEFDIEKSFINAHNPQMALSLYSHVRHLETVRNAYYGGGGAMVRREYYTGCAVSVAISDTIKRGDGPTICTIHCCCREG